mmetsp:Transcript_7719/g.17872  ORF Transcript_7719/g.17872 Transcript_7719/m.17872 type:complete len:288 (-) Transcript_7719:2-865(-)
MDICATVVDLARQERGSPLEPPPGRPVYGKFEVSGYRKQQQDRLRLLQGLGVEDDVRVYHEHQAEWRSVLLVDEEEIRTLLLKFPDADETLRGAGGIGQNITFRSKAPFHCRSLCVGDLLLIGSALLEVVGPRMPCWKHDRAHGVKGIYEFMLTQGYGGAFARILRSGTVCAGDEIRLVERQNPGWSTVRVHCCLYGRPATRNVELLSEIVELETLPEFQYRGVARHRLKVLQAGEDFKDSSRTQDPPAMTTRPSMAGAAQTWGKSILVLSGIVGTVVAASIAVSRR